jgi:hypothetical protein
LSEWISFDEAKAVAALRLDGWPQALSRALSEVFSATEGGLSLDYSHLASTVPDDGMHRYGWYDLRSDRQRFADALRKAASDGRLEFFNAIHGDERRPLRDSASVHNRAAFVDRDESWVAQHIAKHLDDLRDLILDEAPLASVRWMLHSQAGGDLLAHRRFMDALLERLVSRNGYQQVLSCLQPKTLEDGWAFATFAKNNWAETQGFIGNYVTRDKTNGSDERLNLVYALYHHSDAVQDSRWACEQLLHRATPAVLAELIGNCRQLNPDDVRGLLRRLKDSNDRDAKALEPAVRSAFLALGGLLAAPLPPDLALAGLWRSFKFAEPAAPSAAQKLVVESLTELPKDGGGSRPLWEHLGPEARAAWRADLRNQVAPDPQLRRGLLDFCCRWLDQVAFVEVEPVLADLIDDDAALAFVRSLADGGPRLVTLRAMGLVRTKLQLAEAPRRTTSDPDELPDVGAKTWLGDPAAERVIHRHIARAEAEFCEAYPDHWGEDEEMLTRELLGKTREAAKQATIQLSLLARSVRGSFPSIEIRDRQPGKTEEGSKTAAGAPLAADILFLTRILDGKKVLVKRATFVQVKKRRAAPSGEHFGGTVVIDPEQCKHLLTQSEHAFYLILTPPTPAPRLWVAPARLVGNLAQLHASRSSISSLQVRDGSCSFADFFLHQLVGLWSGDERESILAIATGDRRLGRTPRHIVEVEVQRRGD